MPTSRPFALCAVLYALLFASPAFAVEFAQILRLPANGYTFSTHHAPVDADGETRSSCRIFVDGEFLVELKSPSCRYVLIADVSEDYMLITTFHAGMGTVGGDYLIFAFDKKNKAVTDTLRAINYLGAGIDGEIAFVVSTYEKYKLADKYTIPHMPRAHVLQDGRFAKAEPRKYISWALNAILTDMHIARTFTRPIDVCDKNFVYGDGSSGRINPLDADAPADCANFYRAGTAQLREIFSHIDPNAVADPSSAPGDLLQEQGLNWLYRESARVVTRMGTKTHAREYDLSTVRKHFVEKLRRQTDSLVSTSELSWLYKQGRYHVMEKLDLLWSSDPEPPNRHFSIVPAPGGHLLLVMAQPDQPPQPGNTVIWYFDKNKRVVTDALQLSSVTDIVRNGEILTVAEGYKKSEFKDSDPPLWRRLHTLENGRWTEAELEKYTGGQPFMQAFSARHEAESFVARIHLVCRGDMENCPLRQDFAKALDHLDDLDKVIAAEARLLTNKKK
ncbi:MAG: hypothetical protein K8963_10525 [Proteobacteria bacterium]|nr:hypothetical protein [Pseudomonadota bacterium]